MTKIQLINTRYSLFNPAIVDVFNVHMNIHSRYKLSTLSKHNRNVYKTNIADIIVSIMQRAPKTECLSIMEQFHKPEYLSGDEYQDILAEMVSIRLRMFGYKDAVLNESDTMKVYPAVIIYLCTYGRSMDYQPRASYTLNYSWPKYVPYISHNPYLPPRCKSDPLRSLETIMLDSITVIIAYVVMNVLDEANIMIDVFIRSKHFMLITQEAELSGVKVLDRMKIYVNIMMHNNYWSSDVDRSAIGKTVLSLFAMHDVFN